MNTATKLKRLKYLKTKHEKVHKIVEALEGEKAPEENISHQKKIKLSIKDEIASIESMLKAEGVEYVG
jgi:uncharacterized protein YdcH (DUF465 family)